jgi:hypothetical protein
VEVEVIVRKGDRILKRVVRPVRTTLDGEVVRYRGRWWALNGDSIDISGTSIEHPSAGGVPASEREGCADAKDHLPDGQADVTRAPPEERILVDAGPGTGKTFAACRRVAALIADGIRPNRIWIISFTRTAVLEIRSRIAAALEDPIDSLSVRIATLDSHAWSLQSGFSSQAALTGTFDDNIVETEKRLREDPEAAEYLERLRHLIIDEGQDIVGSRADLTMTLVNLVSEECGITVFADAAQAIYNYSDTGSDPDGGSETLVERLQQHGFRQLELREIHRTDSKRLRAIFSDLRRVVLNSRLDPEKRAATVRKEISRLAHEQIGPVADFELSTAPKDSLVLFRRRVDVIEKAAWSGGSPYRLRMSGLPPYIRPWLPALFWDRTDRRVSRERFGELWASRVVGRAAVGAPSAQDAWELLLEAAGESPELIDLYRLREVAGRPNPPLLFCSPEFGDDGPIVGTIHGSKGREADEVFLFLPRERDGNEPTDEETRVLFVGATRARRKLSVGEGSSSGASSLPSGRVWRRRKRTVQVEVGRSGDLDAAGLVGRRSFATGDLARAAQSEWLTSPVRTLVGRKTADLDWDYELLDEDDRRLAVAGSALRYDLVAIANQLGRWPPPAIVPHLRSLGLGAMVLSPSSPVLETLHDPWRRSGFLFTPLLTGFSGCRFGNDR